METDTDDAPRWEQAFSADRETAAPDTRTLIDEEPWAVYRGTGVETGAPTYVEAYLERVDADAVTAPREREMLSAAPQELKPARAAARR